MTRAPFTVALLCGTRAAEQPPVTKDAKSSSSQVSETTVNLEHRSTFLLDKTFVCRNTAFYEQNVPISNSRAVPCGQRNRITCRHNHSIRHPTASRGDTCQQGGDCDYQNYSGQRQLGY